MSTVPHKVPFSFAPVPSRMFAAVRNGDLTLSEWHVLAFLFERAHKPSYVATFGDLDAVARAVAWPHSIDYLSKTLRSLRTKDLITYESRRGPHSSYTIRLCTDWSETSPKLLSRTAADSEAPATEAGPKLAASSPKLDEVAPAPFVRSEHPRNEGSPNLSRSLLEQTSHGPSNRAVVGEVRRAVDDAISTSPSVCGESAAQRVVETRAR